MARTSLKGFNCSIARTLEVLGDKWAILIVRDAFYGVSTFSSFRERLGIARNILTDRLRTLVEHGVLQKVAIGTDGERYAYRLTPRGRELFPVLVAFMQWGDKWIFGPGNEPVRVLDNTSAAPVQQVGIMSRDGRFLDDRDVEFAPGPGASPDTLARFARAKRKEQRAAP